MNIKEMIKNLQEFADDPEKAAVIFSVILKSKNPDIIQRALELYVLLVLNHAEEISKELNEERDRDRTYEQIIEDLQIQLAKRDHDEYDLKRIKRKDQAYKWRDHIKDYHIKSPNLKDYTYLLEDLK